MLNRILKLSTPVVSDVLDEVGVRNNVMSGDIRPVYAKAKVAGNAYTLRFSTVVEYRKSQDTLLIDALDRVARNSVIVQEVGDTHAAVWGELLSRAAVARGALGLVTEGAIRDATKIMAMRFPVFAKAYTPADSTIASAGLARIQLVDCQTAVRCGKVIVNPGDIVFGDFDGIVVIPSSLANEVITMSEDKGRREAIFRDALGNGERIGEILMRYAGIDTEKLKK
jgi:4-hydroxy-4-methyl-2-oxoglutarate aldolase